MTTLHSAVDDLRTLSLTLLSSYHNLRRLGFSKRVFQSREEDAKDCRIWRDLRSSLATPEARGTTALFPS